MAKSQMALMLLVFVALVGPFVLEPTYGLAVPTDYLTAEQTASKVVIDSQGSVHFLWTVHSSVNGSEGIWYAKYEANGTESIPPTQIRNSSLVQSADIGVDRLGVPHIIWVEGLVSLSANSSKWTTHEQTTLYEGALNLTSVQNFLPLKIAGLDGNVVSPAIALDNSTRVHLIWSELKPQTGDVDEYYAMLNGTSLAGRPILIASYNQTVALASQPRVAYDGSFALHVVWVDSMKMGNSSIVSKVNYAHVDIANQNVTRVRVMETEQQLENATVTSGPGGSAYVLWQVSNSSTSDFIYVSRVLRNGQVVFIRQINEPTLTSSSYLALAGDSQENLYLIWYPLPSPRALQQNRPASPTRISYVKILDDGAVGDSGNQIMPDRILAASVTQGGNLYVISTQGIIQVKPPGQGIDLQLVAVAVAISSATIAGISATEDGRYVFLKSTAKATRKLRVRRASEPDPSLLKAIYRRPGLMLHELRNLAVGVSINQLAMLESDGLILSTRDGRRRRFYKNVRSRETDPSQPLPVESIATMILHNIAMNPETWEGEISRNLGLSQQIVHYHLKRLHAANVLTAHLSDRRKHYRLANERGRPTPDPAD